jgi:lipopolysaccharide/colanic/teichoic acid biosynthesis glycosyltransferase
MNRINSLDIYWIQQYRSRRKVLSNRTYLFLKRIMDLSLFFLFMPFWGPLFLVITCAIKISSPKDPVFFLQYRTGRNGKRFRMYKFRTMVSNAEEMKVKLVDLNTLKWPDFKIPEDPRVTPIGRILRKTSLDELPQLINILLGDMSLVGPRPTSFSAESYSLWETERLDVTPGMTGLWQICDRGKSEFDDRARLDIIYIQCRCITLDIEILIRTIFAVLKQRGAF